MRILIKGGVWKNTEDEILKAAVMKYGLNQWARISSLLVRKSAKQCKARWYEWLDPAIKKTEWTREEDEKLLHLAKLMPTQWRTIAPIVGRTPAQCLERYEKLLDAAAAKDESYDPADDPRRLRPGEIDPNPEAKPARPDPVDMDEDEKEMLSEARARLANTRGKKAKRKAREKQLEEARRLASLQKKRELKAAGIDMREGKRKGRGIDYNREVAFEKRPTAGFYDTGEEKEMTKEMGKEFRPVTLEEMEGKRRKDIEKALMKQDADRDARKAAGNAPAAVAANLQMNEATASRRRGKMMLPAPQVSEAELEAIARGGGDDVDLADGAGGATTRRLLGDYATPARFATPMRTPRMMAVNGMDRITMEAQNLARLQAGQTPLAGGENPLLHASDFSGVTPRQNVAATPNPLAAMTPRIGGETPAPGATGRAVAVVGATPGRSVAGTPLLRSGRAPGATPARTPARDALGLNDPDMQDLEGATKREARAREAMLRSELRTGLAGLPQPENEYEITVPELPEADDGGEMAVEDAADVAARKKRAAAEREAAELRKRSQVLQRGLPRPDSLAALPEPPNLARLGGRPAELAEALLQHELIALLQHEAVKHPVKDRRKGKRKRGEAPQEGAPQGPLAAWEDFPEEELQSAAHLLKAETEEVNRLMDHDGGVDEELVEAWRSALGELIYLPSQQRYGRIASATNSDKVESLQSEHEAVRAELTKEFERGLKLEKKLEILTHGYTSRQKTLTASLLQAWSALQDSRTQLACFGRLAEQEERTMPARLAAARARLEHQQEVEKERQERYKELVNTRDELKESLLKAEAAG